MGGGGTGQKLTHATTIVAGVAALMATLLSMVFVPLIGHLFLVRIDLVPPSVKLTYRL